MKVSRRTLLVLAGGALLVAGVAACKHGMYFGTAEERGEWMVQKVGKELELDEIQRSRLAEVKDEFLDMRMTLRRDHAQLQQDVLIMLQQPILDREKLNSIVDQKLATINARAPQIIDAIGEFYDSLDDAQRAEMRAFIEHKMKHHGYRHWH